MNTINVNTINLSDKIIKKVSGGGGGGGNNPAAISENDVNFYDYDGTLLYAYGKDEFLKLKELPPLPTQPGLICQSWNYDFDEALDFVNRCGILDIGALYITDDGATRLYIEITEDNTTIPLSVSVNGTAYIDWGDGTDIEVFVNKKSHVYNVGKYCISIHPDGDSNLCLNEVTTTNTGSYNSIFGYIYNESTKKACKTLKGVNVGKNIHFIYTGTFNTCVLNYITIPNNVKHCMNGTNNECYMCCKTIIFPKTFKPSSFYDNSNVVSGNRRNVINVNKYDAITSIDYSPKRIFIDCDTLYISTFNHGDIITTAHNLNVSSSSVMKKLTICNNCDTIENLPYRRQIECCDFSKNIQVPILKSTSGLNISGNTYVIVPFHLYDEWKNSTNWANYNIIPNINISAVKKLNITVDDVEGIVKNTIIHVDAIIDGIDYQNINLIDYKITYDVIYNIEENLTNSDIIKEVTYALKDITCTNTFIHKKYKTPSCSVNLKDDWVIDDTYNINNEYSYAIKTKRTNKSYNQYTNPIVYFDCEIEIDGYDTFEFYVKYYSSSKWATHPLVVSDIDTPLDLISYNVYTSINITTTSKDDINNYTKIQFNNLRGTKHKLTIGNVYGAPISTTSWFYECEGIILIK